MPIDMRLPKLRGNTSADAMPIGPFRTYSQPVNLSSLEERFAAGEEVTPESLKAKGLIRKVSVDVKILGVGELSKSLVDLGARLLEDRAREDRGRGRHDRLAARRAGRAQAEEAKRASGRLADDSAPTSRRRRRASRTSSRPMPVAGRGRLGGVERGGEGAAVFSWLANAWRVPEIRRRLLFTAIVLAIYRLGSWIPAPGVNAEAIDQYLSRSGGIFNLLNLFSGGALSQFSVFALGIMPYVTASIIVQLMTVVIPRLSELQKEGESGYAKINQYTRYLTVVLAAASGARLRLPVQEPGRARGQRRGG